MSMHPFKRCDRCEFWVNSGHDANVHQDDQLGACHRNAPRSSSGQFEYEVLNLLSTIAWDKATDKQKETDFNNWEEAVLAFSSWPSTSGSDWCGEWQEKT